MCGQQKEMLRKQTHQCTNCIVSIFQPHVRLIFCEKVRNKTEIRTNIDACIVDGYTFIDHPTYNECEGLIVHLRRFWKTSQEG